MQGRAHNSTSM